MTVPVFIGDEVTASGFRLAVMRVVTPEEGDLLEIFERACRNASLIMITSGYLSMLDKSLQEECLMRESPAVVVVPDIRNMEPIPDLSTQLRKKMGMIE